MAGTPVQRLVAKDKVTGDYINLGTVWEDGEGRRSVSFQNRQTDEQGTWDNFRVMLVVETPNGEVEVSGETHFFNLFENEKRDAAPPKRKTARKPASTRRLPPAEEGNF
jgi:hypothetical protein